MEFFVLGMELGDSHIHLFRDGYNARYGAAFARADEVGLYEALRAAHGIGAALVVGYEGEERFAGNNRYILDLAKQKEWVQPLAYCALDNPPAELAEGYRGIALYAMTAGDAEKLCRWPSSSIDLLNAFRSIVSLNARPEALALLEPFAARLVECPILVSHLGLPGAWRTPPLAPEARRVLEPLLRLSALPQIGVKVSGLYAASDPSHDYPHRATHPFLAELRSEFGPRRLYWGSDFSPALEHVSFAQTIDAVAAYGWNEQESEAVMGGNLRRVLGEYGS